jgi:hypothetical protein
MNAKAQRVCSRVIRFLTLLSFTFTLSGFAAVVFTNDTLVNSFDTTYDGSDIVVSNCTLTVDGPHGFLSLLVGPGATVTHSYSSSGNIAVLHSVTNEPQTLTGTNPASLAYTGTLVTQTVTDSGSSITYTQDVDYVMLPPGAGTIQIARTATSAIPDGATVLVSYTVQVSTPAGLTLSITGNVQVAAGGAINVNGRGYGSGIGLGAGRPSNTSPADGSGGSYGGLGGTSSSNAIAGSTYGFFDGPAFLGSGGGAGASGGQGAPGGGLIKISAGGNINVDGALLANGADATNSRAGGGAGGSIWLIGSSVSGSGSLVANGGAGEPIHGGGGGGGRISIGADTITLSGPRTAYGGNGWQFGGAGTVYTSRSNGIDGAVLVDNGGHAGTNTLLNVTTGVDVTVRNAGVVATTTWSVRNLVIASNAFVQASAGPLLLFNVNATGNVTVQAGGALLVDRAGYGPGTGPGAGGYFTSQNTILCGGGGHGGYGGGVSVTNTAGGNVYDSQTGPNIFGSGGGYGPSLLSGYGGGSIHITLSGALQVDGRLSANGGDAIGVGGGGGSGGSIWISAGTLLGNGTISANGGNGNDSLGGGGGGGRVALTVTSNNFIGTISAYGGGGANWGGAGPLYLQVYSGPGATNQLIVDNGGHAGTNSAIQPALTSTALILRNGGAAVQNFPPMTFSTLFIGSNCWLRANTPGGNYPGQANLTVTGNATIQAGGGIVTDAMGSGPGTGQGAGRLVTATPYYYAGGGGHGGYGGGYAPNQFVGGIYYDQPITPSLNGSGGGHLPPNYIGGAGGGWVRLTVNGTLQLDGRLSANGGNAAGFGGGGGSGGSVWLTLGKLTGAGAITANGGNGASITSGGGGGGRIAISFNTNSFAGVISAYGGGPTNWGGAGSIYIRTNSAAYGTMVLDNGGNAGTNSGFLDIPTVDLIVAAGAISPAGSVHNLLIRSNGTVAPFSFAGSPQNINVSGNATIEPGGAISLDGLGYGPGSGPGSGFGNYTGIRGGGGHGGLGAANPIGRGGSYDSITSPNMPGSGGGSASGTSVAPFGGAGGGALNLTILGNGILTVNGRISANGQNGDANSGGGAGGALSINTTTLAGSGSISANGGAGQGSAGGGGGGRIFITWTSNLFTGPVTAAGGNGLVAGGAGTVYLKPRTLSTGQLFIDNGGLVGTNTPLSTVYSLPPSPFNLTISGGGAAMPMTPLPLLSNLTVGTASLLTSVAGQSNLVLAVLGNVNVLTNGSISVAGRGYPQAQGPGAGSTLSSKGAGGGYGGAGGASASGAAGGTNYGSATQPVDRGSGGGLGANTLASGSDGGGALRLSVGGTLNVAGTLSADGNVGLQDDSGGGSGGSIWISANHISGAGAMTANGGNGDLYGGGGGGGGRIAIYSPANTYTGLVTMVGGAGANFGEPGTLHTSNSFLPFQVISSTPSGVLTTLVSFVDLTFNEVVNNYAVSASGFTLNTPNGPLPQINLSAFALSPSTVRVSFPPQSTPGDYLFQLSSGVTSLLGQPISQVYTGMFTIVLPTISGAVTNSSGQGVAGVLMQPNDVFAGVTTDANGNYSLGVPYGWNGTITPALGTSMFVPSFLSFNNVSTPVTGQNFLVVPTIAPLLSSSVSGGNFNLSWPGIAGVSYQAYSSTNLTDWLPVGGSLPGTNGLMQFVTPLDGQPLQFFRIQASD